jgi:WD40 repeat protein
MIGITAYLALAGCWFGSRAASPDIRWLQGSAGASILSASADGRFLASAVQTFPSSIIQLWSVPEHRLLRTLAEEGAISGLRMTLSPDGKWVASSVGERITLWDAATGSILRRWNTPGTNTTALAFDSEGIRLASGSLNGGVQLWGVATGELLQTWKTNGGVVVSLGFLPNTGEWIRASRNSSRQGTLEGWKPEGDTVRTLRNLIQSFEGFTVAPTGDRIVTWASANPNEQIVVLDTADGSVVKRFRWHEVYQPKQVIFAKGSSEVIGIGEFPTVTRFSVDEPALIGGLANPWSIQGGSALVGLGPNGDNFVAAAGNLYLVAENSKGLPPKLNSVNVPFGPLYFAPDSQTLWVDGPLAPLAVADGSILGTPIPYRGVDDFEVSPDGAYVGIAVFSSISFSSSVALYDAATHDFVKYLNVPNRANKMRFFPDSKTLLIGLSDGSVQRWAVPEGTPLYTVKLATTDRTALAVTPDGRFWAAGEGLGGVRIVNSSDGTTAGSRTGPNAVQRLEYSPDGVFLAGLGIDGSISVWQGDSTNAAYRIQIPSQSARDLKFSPDSQVLAATFSDRGEIRFWRARDGRPLLDWNVETQNADRIDFSPDNRWIGYRRSDGTVVLATNPFGVLAPRARLKVQPLTASHIRLSFTDVPPGQLLHLERSTDLSTWETVEELDTPPAALDRDYPADGSEWFFRTRLE